MTGSLSFLRLNNILSYLSQFLYSVIDGHLGCFHIVIMRNNAAMNREVQRPLGLADFISYRYISGRRIAGSSGSTIFSCLRKHHTVSLIASFIYIPTHGVQGSLYILTKNHLLSSFDITYKSTFMKFTV